MAICKFAGATSGRQLKPPATRHLTRQQTMHTPSLQQMIGPDRAPWLAAAFGLMLAATLLEGALLSWRQPGSYDWRACASSVADAAVRRAFETLGLSLAAPLLHVAWQHRLTTLPTDSAAVIGALFIGVELAYYAYHRAAHRVRWFWASHAVHHSPSQLSLAAALRLGWTAQLTGMALFFAPLVWLGFAPGWVAAALVLSLIYQFWIHAAWLPRLWAPVEWLFNTPSHHRVHHGCNPAYLDCNYGGVLIVFDRLFGSFVAERPDTPPRYGLCTPITTYNPLRIALHGWIHLAQDLAAVRHAGAALRVLFGPPPVAHASLAARAAGNCLQQLHQPHHPHHPHHPPGASMPVTLAQSPSTTGQRRVPLKLLAAALGLGAAVLPARAATATAEPSPAALEQALRQLLRARPELVREALDELARRETLDASRRSQKALADAGTVLRAEAGSTVLGNPAGDVTLVEFIDYRCGYCKILSASVDVLLQRDPQLRVLLKHLPILGPKSVAAAQLMLTVGNGADALHMHRALMAANSLDPAALQAIAHSPQWPPTSSAAVDKDLATVQALAGRLGIQGTPALVIGDALVRGALDTEPLAAAIQAARQRRKPALAVG